ncbi:MAG: nitroreductase family protein [Nitrospinae bacterium]|nr:nitroreductase family protein [Nitrospinota bacterium]
MSPIENQRKAGYPIDPMFLDRWSPRAMEPAPITREEIYTLFEAARWAPSCFNEQPWRFIYAMRDENGFGKLLGLLTEGNKVWAKNASALIFVASSKIFAHNGKPNRSHMLDAGAAWMSLALQARKMGMYAHAMAGFDVERSYGELNVPRDGYDMGCAIAVGRYGDASALPPDLREREKPSQRNPLETLVFEGAMP